MHAGRKVEGVNGGTIIWGEKRAEGNIVSLHSRKIFLMCVENGWKVTACRVETLWRRVRGIE